MVKINARDGKTHTAAPVTFNSTSDYRTSIGPLSDFRTPNRSVVVSDSDYRTSIGSLLDFLTPGCSVGLSDSDYRISIRLSDSRSEAYRTQTIGPPLDFRTSIKALSDPYRTFGLPAAV